MQELIRFGRTHRTCRLSLVVACGILFSLTAATQPPHRSPGTDRNNARPIIVNSHLGHVSADPRFTTLPDALAQAAGDARDNLIQFDPAAFGTKPVVIRLTDPIVVDSAERGHDAIDGKAARGGVILDASCCPDAGVVVAERARLTLSALTVRGGIQRAMLAKDTGRLMLEQVTVTGGGGPGLALFGQATASLGQCRLIHNRTHGLELHGRATVGLTDVDVSGNGQSGLAGFDQTAITASDCRLESNGDWNLVLTENARANLTRCLLRQGQFANADVGGSARLELNACTVEKGPRFGLFATGRCAVKLAHTRLHEHGGRGIELQDEAALNLEASRIESNGDFGLVLFGQSAVHASQTAIAANAAHGASLRGQARGHFEQCLFVGNRYSGIGCPDDRDGGRVCACQCTFTQNGMRPIYRGPIHIDPPVPTPLRIQGSSVLCAAEPHATIELFLDPAGEATRYLKTIRADGRGRFRVDCRDVPEGWVMSAAATSGGATSEFNVVAGTSVAPVLNALLARTGPLSDSGERANPDILLRRWKPGTRVIFNLANPPTVAVERYLRTLVNHIGDWTRGGVKAEVRIGKLPKPPPPWVVVIPVRYVEAESPQLFGRGGVTFMKWNAAGFFLAPMEILLARGNDIRETCPRVLAHEIGHTLGLCHARVGLLSRMQGSVPPSEKFVSDFSPTMTYYDVLALQILHDPRNNGSITLREVLERGNFHPGPELARTTDRALEPTFSPAAPPPPPDAGEHGEIER